MDIPWDDVPIFLAVAEAGSLSAAARQLQRGQPTVSRRLAELEARLGYALFRRSVAGATLTEEGKSLLEPARRMAEWAAELSRASEQGESSPRGLVRMTAPPGVAFDFVAPFAGWLRNQLPDIRLQVLSSIRYLDLVRREADLALRFDRPAGRDLVVVGSLSLETRAVASPGYARGLPEEPGLADLDWIAWAPPFEEVPPNPQLAALVPGFRPAFASDDFLVQWRAAEAGVGAMLIAPFAHRFSRPSELVDLGIDLGEAARATLYLVSTRSALETLPVRAVADALVAEFPKSESRGR